MSAGTVAPIFLDVAKTAETLSLSKDEVYKLIYANVLETARQRRADGSQGRKLLVEYTSVLAYAASCRGDP